MFKLESTIAIYKYLMQNELGPLGEPAYYIIEFFDGDGPIEEDHFREVYEDLYPNRENKTAYCGPFESLDELNKFAFQLCQDARMARACILSTDDFNKSVEEADTVEYLLEKLQAAGEVMVNPEVEESSGLLGRLFR